MGGAVGFTHGSWTDTSEEEEEGGTMKAIISLP